MGPAGPDRLLAAFAAEDRPAIPDRVVVVVAHPDDETLGCGALLHRLRDGHLVHVTDGAPRNGRDAARHGCPDAAAYAALRAAELDAALDLLGAGPGRTGIGMPDQGVALDLAGLARRLVPCLAGASLVLTHAVEGGHPDHDGTAFAVRAAARLAGCPVAEMPFYRAGPDGGWVRQDFGGRPADDVLRLAAPERDRKAAALAAHRSQAATLAPFGVADEAFRRAAPFDWGTLPNDGRVLYDPLGWGVTGAELGRLAVAASAALGLDPCL